MSTMQMTRPVHARDLQKNGRRSAGLIEALSKFENLTEFGQALNPPRTRQCISSWDEVPLKYVLQIEELTGVDRSVLRPDLYNRGYDEIVATKDKKKRRK